ncbi:NlpC/P60 family protein [Lentzea sp. BCCO 10_0856]|uniref:NlpC/P60 family protein n=1 Tax=Lentzea miocenica TaxID=3095431 RepID=A0ABU4TGN1_9PSEU|nr:NlpC/P60 family protein [Lentzea sp. BCCO 10_0856]MDX8037210.1 NlpC/P60 family protein [Lentzea sp. BCCO 10_0856]
MKRKGMLVGAGVAVLALLAGVVVFWPQESTDPVPSAVEQVSTQGVPELIYERVNSPARTIVRDRDGSVVATFTDDARSALINGSRRTFSEPKATAATVNTSAWVRLLPQPWAAGAEKAGWFAEWFRAARQDTTPDVLEIATQYTIDAPDEKDAKGVRFRGDASFGPVKASGAGRQEQSDFNDYLGLPWTFANGPTGEPDRGRYGAVDCSGYVRLVFGYRLGMPLLNTNTAGPGLPRRAFAISEFGPGVQLVTNERRRATDYAALQPGDLVFFEVEDDPETLDHVGIYLGIDDRGRHRFISSRERINGPTMGDVGGTSLLDDGGMYSTAWRSARRL